MRFDLLTIFPDIFESYLNESIIRRARQTRRLDLRVHDLRAFTQDKHRTTDDRPYGGGPGMVMKVESIDRALRSIAGRALPLHSKRRQIILLTPQGKFFNQRMAKEFAKLDQLILVCGRYEGFDERIRKLADRQVSIGPYVLTGGELPAMVILDSMARLLPDVLGNKSSPEDETFSKGLDYIEYPQYTRPEVFKGQRVPRALLSGNHRAIQAWRIKHSRRRTKI